MLKSLTLSAALLEAVSSARISRKKDGSSVRLMSGVPIHNYHLAFNADRWETSYMQALRQEMRADEEDWFVMMKKGISNAELERACNAHAQCKQHGHSEGVPFLDVRASEKELEAILRQERKRVKCWSPISPSRLRLRCQQLRTPR